MNYRRRNREGIFENTVCASSTDPVIFETKKRDRERKKNNEMQHFAETLWLM